MSFWHNLALVLIGVGIGSISYLSKSFIFEPLMRFRETLGKIRNRLKYFANILTSPGANEDLAQEASRTCRELSCELEERYYSIPFRKSLKKLGIIQPEKNIDEAARSLIFLSNSTFSGEPLENDKKIQIISSKLWFGRRI